MDYCISDIHGYYGLFCRLLDKIRFGDKDKLYVLGDIIDKGPDSNGHALAEIAGVLPHLNFSALAEKINKVYERRSF